ncbi:recombinase family protein [Clostridium sp. BSD9I1]|uniref:recombinase family protein n=1 Tax=Clostridium sp. BSD9I1 TaxID=2003589 RepID=UPI0016441196|nr:recombinase family protein [Clostridium sp. BSD9I1]
MKAAIYSRKSKFTGKGESVENQVQLCKEYLNNLQVNDFTIYEDEGFSGSNTARPQFQQMLKDARSKKFDVIICYRLDRISRNIADFSNLIDELQKYNISFISIREQFDTSTPMGRAMMYIASVFAQLERETIAERIKDNMLELAKSGRWLGGQTPLGFESKSIIYMSNDYKQKKMYQLSPVAEELEIVIQIYEKYLETHSLSRTLKFLLANNIKGKKGGDFGITSLRDILRNPAYVKSDDLVFRYLESKGMNTCGNPDGSGILVYNKKNSKYKSRDINEWYAATAVHKGIIDNTKWLEVQSVMDKNKKQVNPRMGTSKTALLSGLLKCSHCGSPMRVSYGRLNKKTKKRVYYYTCVMKCNSGKTRCSNLNVKGEEIEKCVVEKIKEINKIKLLNELETYKSELASAVTLNYFSDIENEIQLKKNQMDSLLTKLSEIESPIASGYIISKVESLGKEIEDLKKKLKELESIKEVFNQYELNADIILEALNKFNTTIDLISDVAKKKLMLETIIDSIYWDGDSGEVTVKLWGAKKK